MCSFMSGFLHSILHLWESSVKLYSLLFIIVIWESAPLKEYITNTTCLFILLLNIFFYVCFWRVSLLVYIYIFGNFTDTWHFVFLPFLVSSSLSLFYFSVFLLEFAELESLSWYLLVCFWKLLALFFRILFIPHLLSSHYRAPIRYIVNVFTVSCLF